MTHFYVTYFIVVSCGPCHHGMARPRFCR